MNEILSKGCGWCREAVKPYAIFAFLTEDDVVCSQCMRDTHDKGGCVRPSDYDPDLDPDLNDDVPFNLTAKGKDAQSAAADTSEGKRIIAAAVAKVVG